MRLKNLPQVSPGGLLDLEQDRSWMYRRQGERMSVGARQGRQVTTEQAGSRTGPQTQRNLSAIETQGKSFSGPGVLGSESWSREEIRPYQVGLSAKAESGHLAKGESYQKCNNKTPE